MKSFNDLARDFDGRSLSEQHEHVQVVLKGLSTSEILVWAGRDVFVTAGHVDVYIRYPVTPSGVTNISIEQNLRMIVSAALSDAVDHFYDQKLDPSQQSYSGDDVG